MRDMQLLFAETMTMRETLAKKDNELAMQSKTLTREGLVNAVETGQ